MARVVLADKKNLLIIHSTTTHDTTHNRVYLVWEKVHEQRAGKGRELFHQGRNRKPCSRQRVSVLFHDDDDEG
jgi:hypothetical protein